MKLLVSSVVRGAATSQSHGGLHLVDLARHSVECVLDYQDGAIDFAGRGGDRGLRGLAWHGGDLWVAATDRLMRFDAHFRLLDSHSCPFLRHCHEIAIQGSTLLVVSTGFDAVIAFDLVRGVFTRGWQLVRRASALALREFDAALGPGPTPSNVFHLNMVSAQAGSFQFSGLRTPGLLSTDGRRLRLDARLPGGTHNARPWRGGVIYNDTAADHMVWLAPDGKRVCLAVPDLARTPEPIVENGKVVARARFARGLALLDADRVVGGFSPSAIAVYDFDHGETREIITLSDDVRTAVHGIVPLPGGEKAAVSRDFARDTAEPVPASPLPDRQEPW